MEAKAVAKYIRMSPQKVRLVVDLVRGKRYRKHVISFFTPENMQQVLLRVS
jgi:large subunit ribosomal protein L22